MKKSVLAFLLAVVCSATYALEPFVVSDIRVEGLQRISAGTVFNYLPVKVGDNMDDEIARESIRALFKTGQFEDVKLEQDGTVLVVKVTERPSIASIEYVGNKSIEKDELQTVTRNIGFVEGRVFSPSILDQVTQELKKQYFVTGKYGAQVTSKVTTLERNRVAIVIEIFEGKTAKIKQINIVGNSAFDDKRLIKQFELTPKRVFAFGADKYSRQQLQADLEALNSFYQDQGYLDFQIESTQVTISPDKRDIFVTINIIEGDKYILTDFSIEGKLIVPEAELIDVVSIVPGAEYSRRAVSESRTAIADRLADEGYAFAQINPVPEIDKDNNQVSFTFFVDPGRRVYVRRINISGNTGTQDEVIRRELRQLEGGWFSAKKIQRSRVRLERLGFFEQINIDTPNVPGSPDQVDVNISVVERATGSLLFGVGYSESDGVLFQAAIQQRNLFGTGRELDLTFDDSAVTNVIRLQYLNPYHTIDGVSRGFNVFRRTVDANEADTAEYITETIGGGINYRFPLSEFNTFNVQANYERVDLQTTSESPPEIVAAITEQPVADLFKLSGSFAYDTRDSVIGPTRGTLHRVNWETAVPGSDAEFYKLSYRASWFLPVTRRLVLKVGGEFGFGDGYGSTGELPFYENFFAGGSTTVRGYSARSLGPRDSGTTPEPLGGDRRVLVNAELLFPIPGSESNDKRFFLFFDGGQVYGPGQGIDLGDLRYSVGVGFNWYSPVGPLAISWGQAINDRTGDETERLQITLGRFFQ